MGGNFVRSYVNSRFAPEDCVRSLIAVIFALFCFSSATAVHAISINQLSPGKSASGALDFSGRQYVLPSGKWLTVHRESRTGIRGVSSNTAAVVLAQVHDKKLGAMVRLVIENTLQDNHLADASLCDDHVYEKARAHWLFNEKFKPSIGSTECFRISTLSGDPAENIRGPWGHAKTWLMEQHISTPFLGFVAEYDYRTLSETVEFTVWQPVWSVQSSLTPEQQETFKTWALQFRDAQRQRFKVGGASSTEIQTFSEKQP